MTKNDYFQLQRMKRLKELKAEAFDILDEVEEAIELKNLRLDALAYSINQADGVNGMDIQQYRDELMDTIRYFQKRLSEASDWLVDVEVDLMPH